MIWFVIMQALLIPNIKYALKVFFRMTSTSLHCGVLKRKIFYDKGYVASPKK